LQIEEIAKERKMDIAELEELEAQHRDMLQALAEKKEQLQRDIQRMKELIEKGMNFKPRSFGDLQITVLEAKELPQTSNFDKNDPYCVVWLHGTEHKHQTKTMVDAGEHAVWNESLTWKDIEQGYTTLKVEVWEADELKDDDLMGKVSLPPPPTHPPTLSLSLSLYLSLPLSLPLSLLSLPPSLPLFLSL
jgi:hypothetical protein